MTYEEVLLYIKECTKFGCKLGLERINEILKRLGNPEQKFRAIHIAGTNGKGSTSAMLGQILQQAGFRTGRYNSPHLVSYRERYTINGSMITKAQLAAKITKLKPVIDQVLADGFGAPTEFEVGTALAFQFFADEGVDWAIIEVGMGGRFDATNVLQPALSVITHIALDHQEYLGDTLEKIAFEKAGIIKTGVPVVIGLQEPSIRDYFVRCAQSRQAPCLAMDAGQLVNMVIGEGGTQIEFDSPSFGRFAVQLALCGVHQAENASNAIGAVEMLNQSGQLRINRDILIEGLNKTRWPGRFERINTSSGLKLYLDGSHNPDGARALVRTIKAVFPGQKVDLLVGILNNRPLAEMAGILGEIARQVIVTRVPDPKSASPDELGPCFEAVGLTVVCEPDPANAMQLLLKSDNPVAVATGSLYLAGLLRGLLLNIGD